MISENVGLFLLQSLGGVRAGGTEGLPEDGGEGDAYGQEAGQYQWPQSVHHWYALKDLSCNEISDRQAYDVGYYGDPHELAYVACRFALHCSSKDLMYRYALGVFAGEV